MVPLSSLVPAGVFSPRQGVSVTHPTQGESRGSGRNRPQYQLDESSTRQSTARLLACHKVARLGTRGILRQLAFAQRRVSPPHIPSGLARVASARTNTPAEVSFCVIFSLL